MDESFANFIFTPKRRLFLISVVVPAAVVAADSLALSEAQSRFWSTGITVVVFALFIAQVSLLSHCRHRTSIGSRFIDGVVLAVVALAAMWLALGGPMTARARRPVMAAEGQAGWHFSSATSLLAPGGPIWQDHRLPLPKAR